MTPTERAKKIVEAFELNPPSMELDGLIRWRENIISVAAAQIEEAEKEAAWHAINQHSPCEYGRGWAEAREKVKGITSENSKDYNCSCAQRIGEMTI